MPADPWRSHSAHERSHPPAVAALAKELEPKLWWPAEWWRRAALVTLYVLAPILLLDLLFPPPLKRAE